MSATPTTSARLLQLLGLLQSRRDWPGPELAERLGVTERTVRRDVDRLRELDYPIVTARGREGGYRLGAGAALPPLLLDPDEALAVAVGVRTAAIAAVSGLEESSLRAAVKLEQILPSRLRERLRALGAVDAMATRTHLVDPEVLLAVAIAVRDRQVLRLDHTSHDGTTTRRRVEPHRVVTVGRRWYVVAYDLGKEAWRTFRLDRVLPVVPTGPRFVPRELPMDDLTAYVSDGLTRRAYRYRSRVVADAPWDEAAHWFPDTAVTVSALPDGRSELATGSDDLDVLAVHLAAVPVPFTVLEPPELVEHLAVLAARLDAAYRRSTAEGGP